MEFERFARSLGDFEGTRANEDVTRLGANNDGPIGTECKVLLLLENAVILDEERTLTAVDCRMRAHTLWGLMTVLSLPSTTLLGGAKVNTSPFRDKAPKVSSQVVILVISVLRELGL